MEGRLLMAVKEQEEGGAKKGGGWFKALLGTVGGLISGAVVMYASALVDKAIKPAKPVPNFRVEYQGCTVHFQNLSPGFTGWWDFGDGTELVPADGNHESIQHTYGRPGDYSVKLSLSNLLGEENDRTVSLHVEEAPAAKQPKVVSLTAVRVSPGTGAPATYKVTAVTQNAPLCIWDFGDDRPKEPVAEETGVMEKMLTFDKPGDYAVELQAINETLIDDKTEVIDVKDAPAGTATVTVNVSDGGTWVKTRTQPCTFSDSFRPDAKGDVCALSGRELSAAGPAEKNRDWLITDLQLTGANGKAVSLGDRTEVALDAAGLGLKNARSLRLQLAPDRKSVRLSGELTRAPGAAALPNLMLQGVMTEELRVPHTRTVPLPAALAVPAAGKTTTQVVTLPPAPANWVDPKPRVLRVTVQDGATVVAQDLAVPCRTELTLQNRRCVLTATPGKDQVRLDLAAK